MHKGPGERLGISIRGGAKGHPGNPLDKSDEGIFVSKVNEGGVAFKDGRLKVGQRLLEVSVKGSGHNYYAQTGPTRSQNRWWPLPALPFPQPQMMLSLLYSHPSIQQ